MTSIYSQPFIHHFTGLFGTNTVGLLAQLVEHCTGIPEVMGSNPYRPEFFSGFLFTTT